MAGSTISSTVTNAVTLGYGVYLSPLSITAAGVVDAAAGPGILISDVAGTVINSGSVISGGLGVFLDQANATVINQGYLEGSSAAIKVQNYTGGEALVVNGGTLIGGFGITGQEASVTNSGFISGSNYGIRLEISTIANTGTIEGRGGIYTLDGTLSNHGSILGKLIGVSLAGGIAVNSGSISGSLGTGAEVDDEIGGVGATIAGSLLNDGTISGGVYGVYDGTGGFTNAGVVSGRIGLAVGVGGAASNSSVIEGSAYGAELLGRAISNGGASLNNTGSITGGEIGVTLGAHATLTNAGYIYGPNDGVAVYDAYLTNSGSIVNANVGVTLSGAAAVTENLGTINALGTGVAMSAGLVTNYGTIYGTADGAYVTGGSLVNFGDISGGSYGFSASNANVANYGLISSANVGAYVARGVFTNAGTISGNLDALKGSFVTLVVDPGAVFDGQVDNFNGKSLLELSGAGLGTLGGIGSQITGFKEVSFATGPQWSIEGDESGLTTAETIVGFAKGDTIVLDGFSATSDIYVKNTGLELSNADATITMDITGNFNTGGFQVSSAGTSTTIIDVTCFAEGTRIATPEGEVAVEALRIGDAVKTLHGGTQKVKWIGRRSYGGRFLEGNKAVLPVRIKAGAIADGVPARDLRVSPGHAISIDAVLVHAIRLVNGVSVLQENVAEVRYFHVELAAHEILLAENCPAESFMDEHFRRQFQNAGEFHRLYPGEVAPALMCQPRLDSGFQLDAIQRRLRARAGLRETQAIGALRGYVDSTGPGMCFGWAQDSIAPEVPVSLDIFNDGRRIGRVLANIYRQDVAAAGYGDGYQGFEFPVPAGTAGTIEVRRSSDGAKLALAAGVACVDAKRVA